MKTDGSIIKSAKNAISVLDGLVLLTQPSLDPDKVGKPYGIELQSFVNTLSTDREFNTDYGSFILTNNARDDGGFLYGFYDNKKKEFLGNPSSHSSINPNVQNLFTPNSLQGHLDAVTLFSSIQQRQQQQGLPSENVDSILNQLFQEAQQ